MVICVTIRGKSFPDRGYSFGKDPKQNKLGPLKGHKQGQGDWSVGSKVEIFKMSQRGRWEPDHAEDLGG